MNAQVRPGAIIDAMLKHWAIWAMRDQSDVRGYPTSCTLEQIQLLQLVEKACTAQGKETKSFKAPESENDPEAEATEAAIIKLRGYSLPLYGTILAEYLSCVPLYWAVYDGPVRFCRQAQGEAAPVWRQRMLKALGMGQRAYEDRLRRARDYLSAILL
jgi:hypothetical protein